MILFLLITTKMEESLNNFNFGKILMLLSVNLHLADINIMQHPRLLYNEVLKSLKAEINNSLKPHSKLNIT